MISVEVLKSLFDLYEQLKDQNPKMANGIKNAITSGVVDYFGTDEWPNEYFGETANQDIKKQPHARLPAPWLREQAAEQVADNPYIEEITYQPRPKFAENELPLDNLPTDKVWRTGEGMVLTADEHEMAKADRKIDTLKSIRARLNLGLKEAKDLYETFYPPQIGTPHNFGPAPQVRGDFAEKIRKATVNIMRERAIADGVMEALTTEEHVFAKNNRKIEAIRSIRDRLHLGLKESKDLYEFYYPIKK